MMEHPEYRDESRVIHMNTCVSRLVALLPQLKREEFVDGAGNTERVLYNLMILGEAANNVSREFAAKHPNVDFRDMAALRHKLVHDYANTNLDIVWNILQVDLPIWKKSLAELCASLPLPPKPDNLDEFS